MITSNENFNVAVLANGDKYILRHEFPSDNVASEYIKQQLVGGAVIALHI